MNEKRLAEIKSYLVFRINEAADGMWETAGDERRRWKAVKDAYEDMYKRIFNETYYGR